MARWATHLKNPRLQASFAIGFLILFVFIGVFTYVNFVLVGDPHNIDSGMLGLLYLIFAPSIITTPAAGRLQIFRTQYRRRRSRFRLFHNHTRR